MDWGITRYIASLLDLPIGDQAEIEQGRLEVAHCWASRHRRRGPQGKRLDGR